ncbi:MAG: alpha-amylase [Bacteroidales bacterium]|nr:alpha-amylase [Bacteroidales bacterium]
MKKLVIAVLAVVAVCMVACKEKAQVAPVHPEWTYNSVVYEVNIRQFTQEGTFAALEQHLPRLKDLGVDIVWLMPMYEIGTEGRKGTLGSYYAISDYKKVNPEFGTMEDFEHMLATAHELGLKVILDWVANQTAPDHVWMTERPADFYERDSLGNAIWEYDWTDTRSLNYENEEVWWAQDDAMRFWLEKGVDGFRCDAAGEVPAEFWKGILPKMNKDYPDIYLLAEAERANLADPTETFDANYAWELHHLLNSMAQGSKIAADLKAYVEKDAKAFPKEAFRLTFTSNHDENSWQGTEFEREGKAAQACAVLCFTLPNSQPLIYTGQEIGMDHRLAFFEKDPIDWGTPNDFTDFYGKLTALKHENHALDAGERGGEITWWETGNDGMVAFHREKDGNKVIVLAYFGESQKAEQSEAEASAANDNRPQGETVAEPFKNLESAPIHYTVKLDGIYTDVFHATTHEGEYEIDLAPGDYIVLTK